MLIKLSVEKNYVRCCNFRFASRWFIFARGGGRQLAQSAVFVWKIDRTATKTALHYVGCHFSCAGETRRTTSVNIHVSSDSTTLRSFLMGMSVGMNSVRDPSHQMTQGDRLLSFLAERALQRQNIIPTAYRGGRDCVGNSDRSFECEENHSHGLFRDAIMQLPVPHAIKRYLLFYRE